MMEKLKDLCPQKPEVVDVRQKIFKPDPVFVRVDTDCSPQMMLKIATNKACKDLPKCS